MLSTRRPRLSALAYLDLLKALIQVKAHTRKDGTQVRAHQRNIQSRAERKELVEALARKMAGGEHTRHASLASAVGAARYASRANGKAVHVYEHPEGGWVATHDESHTEGHAERIVAVKGRARLHRAGEASRSLRHLKGPIAEHVEKPAPAPKVKPARPKAEKKQPEPPAPEPEAPASEAEALRAQAEALGIRLNRVEQRALANSNPIAMAYLRKQIEKRQAKAGGAAKPAAPKPEKAPAPKPEKPAAPKAEKPAPEPEKPVEPAPEKPAPKPEQPAAEKAKPARTGGTRGEREYEDVGEKIGGARKDLAAEFAAGEKNFQNIDWEDMRKRPEEAARYITKKNLIGHWTPDAMREGGMQAHAAYFMTALLRTVAPAPKDSPDARYRYAKGLDRLSRAMRNVKTMADVKQLLLELGDEVDGVYGTPDELEPFNLLSAALTSAQEKYEAADNARSKAYIASQNAELRAGKVFADSRAGLATREDLGAARAESKAASDRYWAAITAQGDAKIAVSAALRALQAAKKDFAGRTQGKRDTWDQCYDAMGDGFYVGVQQLSSALRGTVLLGNDTRLKKKSALLTAVEKMREMDPGDWTWTERGAKEAGGKSQFADAPINLPAWTREVPEQHERTGGKVVDFGALSKDGKIKPDGLMQAFGLRAVEYGNWVTQDEAAHHTQRAGEALQDLAAILDLNPEQVSYGKRLALAIGARGKGSKNFGAAAAAHYEPDRKVINITKVNGGGSLAHEWGHFLDNVVAMVSHDGEAGHMSFMTDLAAAPEGAPAGTHPKVLEAMRGVLQAMKQGDVPMYRKVKPPEKVQYRPNERLDRLIAEHGPQGALNKYAEDHIKTLRRVPADAPTHTYAAAERKAALKRVGDAASYIASKTATAVHAPSGAFGSNYHATAEAQPGEYHANPQEMFARAFEAYVQDKGAARGVRNSYLVSGAKVPDGVTWNHPLVGKSHMSIYPHGEERTHINAAMDGLMAALRETGTLQKALAAIAGPSSRLLFGHWR